LSINEILIGTSVLLALFLYYPLIAGILRVQNPIEQNVATWILWVALDAIALISVIQQNGNYLLLAVYCIAGTAVVYCLLYKKLFKWTKFESFVLVLVVICLIIWGLSGSRGATIASTIAVWISGCPQIRDSWRKPDRTTGLIYVGFTVANGLSFLGGEAWTIEETFYPGMMTTLCAAIAVAALRRTGPTQPLSSEQTVST
jgi:hypothetical protein